MYKKIKDCYHVDGWKEGRYILNFMGGLENLNLFLNVYGVTFKRYWLRRGGLGEITFHIDDSDGYVTLLKVYVERKDCIRPETSLFTAIYIKYRRASNWKELILYYLKLKTPDTYIHTVKKRGERGAYILCDDPVDPVDIPVLIRCVEEAVGKSIDPFGVLN